MKGNFEQKHCGSPERVWCQSRVGRRRRRRQCSGVIPVPLPQCLPGYLGSVGSQGRCYGPSYLDWARAGGGFPTKQPFCCCCRGWFLPLYPHLPLQRHAMPGFPALLTACVVYAYISTNTVKCLLSRRVLTIDVCVYVCASILTAFLGSGVLFYCSEDTLLYNVYIF